MNIKTLTWKWYRREFSWFSPIACNIIIMGLHLKCKLKIKHHVKSFVRAMCTPSHFEFVGVRGPSRSDQLCSLHYILYIAMLKGSMIFCSPGDKDRGHHWKM